MFHIKGLDGVRAVALIGVRHGVENLATYVIYFGALVTVARLSYRLYESWFLRLKDRAAFPRFLVAQLQDTA